MITNYPKLDDLNLSGSITGPDGDGCTGPINLDVESVQKLRALMIRERLNELKTLEANSDCIEDGCGLDAELLRDNLLRRIRELEQLSASVKETNK